MLNIGGAEFLVIMLVALVVLGPERLPQVARQLGQTVESLRRMARGFQSEFEAAARPTPQVPKATDAAALAAAARAVDVAAQAEAANPVSDGGPTELVDSESARAADGAGGEYLADLAQPDDALAEGDEEE